MSRAEVALDGATGDAAVALVTDLVRRLLASTGTPVLGIGVGSPGVVDPLGVVRSAPNLGWTDVDLQGRLHAEFELPVHVANDANDVEPGAVDVDERGGLAGTGVLALAELDHEPLADQLGDEVGDRDPGEAGLAGDVGPALRP